MLNMAGCVLNRIITRNFAALRHIIVDLSRHRVHPHRIGQRKLAQHAINEMTVVNGFKTIRMKFVNIS